MERGVWRRRGRPVALCVLVAAVLLWIVVGRAPYTSGQFTDYETDTSEAIWMTTHPADIKIIKTTDAAGFFEFTSDIPGCPATFSFTFAEAGTQEWLCNPVDAGTYAVSETTVGWDVTIECIESDTANSDDDNPPTASIVLEEFEKVVCTFTNEVIDTGTLSVDLDYSDDSTAGLAVNVSCTDGASPETNGLTAAEGTPAEFTIVDLPLAGTTCNATLDTPPSGYDVDDSDCQGVPLSPVSPNEACTIVLTALGSITVFQDSPPGQETVPVTFQFSANLSDCEAATFTLADGDDRTCDDLSADTYVIEQLPGDLPPGWFLTDITCDASTYTDNTGAGTVEIVLDVGEVVTCTFTNEEPA